MSGKNRKILAAVVAAAVAAVLVAAWLAGGDGVDGERGTTAADAAAGWAGPPRASDTGEVQVAAFNDYARRSSAAWRRSALLTTVTFLDLARADAASTSLVVREPAPQTSRATVVLDGLRDDSVHAVRWVVDLRQDERGRWQLVRARRTQRCALGRGHQEFTPELCL